MPNNVLVVGDSHVHSHKRSNDRLEDCLKTLEWTFTTAIEHDVKTVIGLGDLFHDRTKIEVLTLHKTFQLFEKYFGRKKPFDLMLLLGNHDLWHRDRWEVNSPAFLSAFDGVTVVDKPCSLEVQEHFVDFLPFTEDPIADLINLKSLVPRKPGEKRLLCSHLAVHGAMLNRYTEADVVVEHDGEMVKVDQDRMGGWDQVLLGHYHGAQILGRNNEIEYVGSTMELTKSEAFQQKHIILFDLDTFEIKHIINTFSPKHLVLRPDQLKDYDLDKHFVTVMVPEEAAQSDVVDIRQEVLKNHKVGSLEIKTERKRADNSQDQKAVKDARAILESQDKMLERYLAECSEEELKGLDPKLLLEIGKQIIEVQPEVAA